MARTFANGERGPKLRPWSGLHLAFLRRLLLLRLPPSFSPHSSGEVAKKSKVSKVGDTESGGADDSELVDGEAVAR